MIDGMGDGAGKRLDRRVDIGHVHLKVADLDRALAFYHGVLGFDVTQRMGDQAAFLSAGGYHHHIGLNTWESQGGSPPPPGTTGLYHLAIRYPDRTSLGEALLRLDRAGIALDGASDHGVSEALYLRDPDQNGVELYWDRPRDEWPRASDGSLRMVTERLDLRRLRAAAIQPPASAENDAARNHLLTLRGRLLNLHKVLIDDAKATYELDRGRVGSAANLLQLVIGDPWFAWLHALSELVVRIDETVDGEKPPGEAEVKTIAEQVGALLTASEDGEGFAKRYFESLQRQPAVVLAHADVRQALKAMRAQA